MKKLFIGIVITLFSACGVNKRVVEVTCPTYSKATLVTYRHKKGTSKNTLKKKSKEEYYYQKTRGGKNFNSLVKMQAPKGKRFTHDRKKTQKNILKTGLIRGTPKQNKPYQWNGQKK